MRLSPQRRQDRKYMVHRSGAAAGYFLSRLLSIIAMSIAAMRMMAPPPMTMPVSCSAGVDVSRLWGGRDGRRDMAASVVGFC